MRISWHRTRTRPRRGPRLYKHSCPRSEIFSELLWSACLLLFEDAIEIGDVVEPALSLRVQQHLQFQSHLQKEEDMHSKGVQRKFRFGDKSVYIIAALSLVWCAFCATRSASGRDSSVSATLPLSLRT